MEIVLASASPRRHEILKKHGVAPLVMPSGTDERLPSDMRDRPVEEIVMYLARKKARAVYEILRADNVSAAPAEAGLPGAPPSSGAFGFLPPSDSPRFVLGADTVVYKDGIIGKPEDEADAFRILSSLRASAHRVITGVSLIETVCGTETDFFDVTTVYFKDYPDAEIYRYIREEAPYDKSGSYAVQSSWAGNVERIEGDVENVMGLPWRRVETALRARGYCARGF
ncbi:MAG: Maf family protein [Clostridiales Family XIII bacterium]|jgi:septum formation protein|nr:Maf family protein [Clostridiales Family XIII bacterium]